MDFVVAQVEYDPPFASTEVDNDLSSPQSPLPSEQDQPDEEAVLNILWPGHKEQRDQKRVSEVLAEYGYYARSMKPQKGWVNQCIAWSFILVRQDSSPSLRHRGSKARRDQYIRIGLRQAPLEAIVYSASY